MKELLRTTLAAVVGAVVAIAVVVGQPALAHEAAKAKGKKVTSAQIKDGTIQTRDLSAPVLASLTKADSALQSLPDGSVTTSKLANGAVSGPKLADGSVGASKLAGGSVTGTAVQNGSLTMADVAEATGTQALDYANLPPGNCVASLGIETGTNTTGDYIEVAQPSFAGNVSFFGRPDADHPTQIDIVECNNGNGAFDAPGYAYAWAVIGH